MPTPVWYTEYRNQLIKDGICVRCGDNEPIPGYTMCDFCNDQVNEYRKVVYTQNKARGVCTRHPGRKAVAGKVACQQCLDKDRARGKRRNRKKENRKITQQINRRMEEAS